MTPTQEEEWMSAPPFERYGGFAKLRDVVSDLYDRTLDSPTLQNHFSGIDMRRLVDHQTKFIASLLGGPAAYTDEALRRAHARLAITHDEFEEMSELLREVLEDHDFDPADIDLIVGEFRRREPTIVTRPARKPGEASGLEDEAGS
jgi:hemoglobin